MILRYEDRAQRIEQGREGVQVERDRSQGAYLGYISMRSSTKVKPGKSHEAA